jgi:hypothetical protein
MFAPFIFNLLGFIVGERILKGYKFAQTDI